MSDRPGRLIIVGTGITGVSQLTLEAVAWIEAADVVCYVLADPLTERWIGEHARGTEDLTRLHRSDVPRLHAYRAMSERLVEHARHGRLVVGVFYGHPGVFTSPSHWAVESARAEGIPARMLPAVSAEDCLFADLGIDPGDGACQSFEATDMIIRARVPATDAHLVVWQVGVVAQLGLETGGARVAELVRYLERFYPAEHMIIHYQAAQSVVADPTIEPVPLSELGISCARGHVNGVRATAGCARVRHGDGRVRRSRRFYAGEVCERGGGGGLVSAAVVGAEPARKLDHGPEHRSQPARVGPRGSPDVSSRSRAGRHRRLGLPFPRSSVDQRLHP